MRVLSRIFGVFSIAVALCFTAIFPSVADMPKDSVECMASGFYWVDDQCCWLYTRDSSGKLVCVDENNWGDFPELSECDPLAGYIDLSGTPHCCPDGTIPNPETHRCDCDNGAILNVLTGQCDMYVIQRSPLCNSWNKESGPGHFFNYLIRKLLNGVYYKSLHTCQEVITALGDNSVVWNEDACRCSCANQALTFNPGAADECAEGVAEQCDNICVDLTGQEIVCPMGQRAYYINDAWTCCIYYDPERESCINTDSAWVQYAQRQWNSGGGYIGPDGLPIECPIGTTETGYGVEVISVNETTGKCTCAAYYRGANTPFTGFFDTTTGTCRWQYQLNTRYGPIDPSGLQTSGSLWINNAGYVTSIRNILPTDTISSVGQEQSTTSGFVDEFLHTVFNQSGVYSYTPLPVSSVSNTPYIATDLYANGQYVTASYLVTVTYNGNGGTPATQTRKHAVGGINWASEVPPAPTRSGYTFVGWYDTSATTGGTNVSSSLPAMTANKTYYARWSQNAPTTSTITLNKNGGTGTCGGVSGTNNGSITCTVGGNCTLPSWNASTCNLTKSGNKIFVGWTTTAPANHTSSTTGTTGSISSPASNTTYYAVWKDTSCSVTNGTAAATTPSNNAPRCVVTCNTGYQTSETYTGTAGNPAVDTAQCSARTVRVLANDSNGNSYNNWVSCAYGGTCTLQSGNVFSAPSGSSGFEKWLCRIGSHNASGTTCGDFTSGQTLTVAQSNTLVLADTEATRTLYACWNYGITYNLNGGTAATTASSRPTSYNHCDGATIGGTAAASKPTRTGYTFAGWCDDAELTSNCDVTRTISAGTTGAKTYYAKWTTDAYTVTLDANDGTIPSGGTTSVSATYGDAMPAIQTGNKLPTREYYTFAGYYDTSAATGGTMYYTAAGASAHTWDKTSDTTLYARWTKVSYTLQLSKAPITDCQFADKYYYYTPADEKWYSNAALTNEITTGGVNYDPSCDGYVFRGWYWNSPSGYNDPIGSGAVMTHNTTIAAGQNAPNSYQPYALNANNLTGKSLSSNAHLFARWAKNCATVANGSCSLNVEANGNVTYTDSCNSNYSLVENGVYNPVCSPVYTVSFNANGGSGSASPTSVTCVYDQDCTLAAKGTLAKSNATFDGWNTETDGSGNGYLESDTVQNLTSTAGATVVLYAVWRTSGCSAGQYLDDGDCVSCPAGYSCAGGDASPIMCGTNKYSTGGAVSCSSCTSGLTTSPIADSRYHDEAADCGRVLHIGAYEIRLKSIPSTGSLSSLVPSPALRFNYAGNANGRPDFYANMSTIASPMRVTTANNDGTGAISTTGSGDKFKTRYNNTNYYVCDDVTCVTE
ncbi:MAG: InlB B-repeat-containing protein [Alphaproteobacteria bacterium]